MFWTLVIVGYVVVGVLASMLAVYLESRSDGFTSTLGEDPVLLGIAILCWPIIVLFFATLPGAKLYAKISEIGVEHHKTKGPKP